MSLLLLFIFFIVQTSVAQPSPGYYPSSKLQPLQFYQGYNTLWGPQHQSLSQDQYSLTIWLDTRSGSGFKSTRPYRNGYFAASIKLQTGYTAGVITSLYVIRCNFETPCLILSLATEFRCLNAVQLSNSQAYPGFHDEVDIEFLGTTLGKPYTLQTNVYVKGSGDGRLIGREMRFHLWFDPTAAFHNYAILWNPDEIIFYVDDIPIRRYAKKSDATYPQRPLWVYGSIWDASSWATENGKYKADYRYQPFVARYTKFLIGGCSASAPSSCRPVAASPLGLGLSSEQNAAMRWAQANYMVYYYCSDSSKDHSLTPECYL